jgi:uncharacterized membrane protein YfcA
LTAAALALLAGLLVVVAGTAIGATSVGGILVLPALTSLLQLDVARVVAATSGAFLATGLVTVVDLGRAADARREVRDDLPLHLAALVGAALGAYAVHIVPTGWVRLWIAALAFTSGVHALAGALTRRARVPAPWPRSAIVLGAIGLAVGLGSGLSGTGGPILLLPVLLLMRQDLARSVAAALVLQVPIALASTTVHAVLGRLDVVLALAIAAGLTLGVWVGRRLAKRADVRVLRIATGLVLLATGLGYGLA